jgi:hypothetical protein
MSNHHRERSPRRPRPQAETLVDQMRAFVARARLDGVDVTEAVYPDMVHGFAPTWAHRDAIRATRARESPRGGAAVRCAMVLSSTRCRTAAPNTCVRASTSGETTAI